MLYQQKIFAKEEFDRTIVNQLLAFNMAVRYN